MRHTIRAFLVLASGAVLLAGLRWTTPSYAVLTGPIPTSGEQGETVAGRSFTAKVRDVRLADRLQAKLYGKTVERDTSGVWTVVSAEVEATAETSMVTAVTWLGPSGRHYVSTQRLEGLATLLETKPLQPGLPESGLFVFELPPDEVEGGVLLLSSALRYAEPRLDSELRIRLATDGLTSDETLELPYDG